MDRRVLELYERAEALEPNQVVDLTRLLAKRIVWMAASEDGTRPTNRKRLTTAQLLSRLLDDDETPGADDFDTVNVRQKVDVREFAGMFDGLFDDINAYVDAERDSWD